MNREFDRLMLIENKVESAWSRWGCASVGATANRLKGGT